MAKLNELYLQKTELDELMEEWLKHRHSINECFDNFLSFLGGSLSLNESEEGESDSTNGFAEIELSKIDGHIKSLDTSLVSMNRKADHLISENKTPILTDYDKMHKIVKKLSNNTEEYREELKQEIALQSDRMENAKQLLDKAADCLSRLDAVDDRFMDFVEKYNKHTYPHTKIELRRLEKV